jgi:hypothetical protein
MVEDPTIDDAEETKESPLMAILDKKRSNNAEDKNVVSRLLKNGSTVENKEDK